MKYNFQRSKINKSRRKQSALRTRMFFLAFMFTAVLLVLAYIALNNWVARKNEEVQFFHIMELGKDHAGEDVTGNVMVTDEWNESNGTCSMKYEAWISNNTEHDISDWTVEMPVLNLSSVIDHWNGEIAMNDENNLLTFYPMEDLLIIPAGQTKTFGFILSTPMKTKRITDATLHCRMRYVIQDFWTYWAIWVLGGIVVIGVIVNILWRYREVRFFDLLDKEQEILDQAIRTFVNLIDAKDSYTRGHSARVAQYSVEIGRRMGKSEEELDRLYIIALMHDVGKMSIPDSVLNKPGKLEPDEWEVIQTHTTRADIILKNFTAIEHMADGAKYHHEKYNGSGYPEGLAGKDIPECARIICVADAFDAMSTDRCYRKKLPIDVIMNELKECAGTQFDPDIIPYMLDYLKDYSLVEV